MAGLNLTGQGNTIAVIDTGMDWTHPDLAGKNILGCNLNCFDDPDTCFIDCSNTDVLGHGTHVGGIAGASGVITGIGAGVDLISLNVFGDSGNGDGEALMTAIYWAVEHREEYNITVISMSLSDGVCHDGYCDDISGLVFLRNAVNAAVEAGIACVCAAGNQGCSDGIGCPACFMQAIPAAGTTKEDERWGGSNYSETVMLFAPAKSILSTCVLEYDPDGYCAKTGTSASTPMISGAIGILRQFVDTIDHPMTPAEMEQLLFDTGDPIVDLPFEHWRRINIYNAILALIDTYVTPGDVNIDGTVDTADLLLLLSAWGDCPEPPGWCAADVDRDGDVDVTDLLTLLGNWG